PRAQTTSACPGHTGGIRSCREGCGKCGCGRPYRWVRRLSMQLPAGACKIPMPDGKLETTDLIDISIHVDGMDGPLVNCAWNGPIRIKFKPGTRRSACGLTGMLGGCVVS